MKKWVAAIAAWIVAACANAQTAPTCPSATDTCYLRGAFLAGAPKSPTMNISLGLNNVWVGVVPWSWWESYGVFEYAGVVHLQIGGFAGTVRYSCGRFSCYRFENTDVPAPPVLYQAVWNGGNNTIASLGAVVPIVWSKTVSTLTLNGVSYTYTTWVYEGPLDAAINPKNLDPTLTFALQAACVNKTANPGACSYSSYQYANLVPLPPPGDQ